MTKNDGAIWKWGGQGVVGWGREKGKVRTPMDDAVNIFEVIERFNNLWFSEKGRK